MDVALFALVVTCSCSRSREQLAAAELTETRDALQRERGLRGEEREARIHMQRGRRQHRAEDSEANGYRMKPIGYVESPFPDRRGTPRQPLLVTSARGRIRFKLHVDYFRELQEFSHVWVLFVFHANTSEESGCAKVKPPRLGRRVGCLSTRSPHRCG